MSACQEISPEHFHPIHEEIVAPVTAPTATLEAAYRSWSKQASIRPGSTFTIWSVGENRHQAKALFTTTIPEHWPGGNILAAKVEYRKRGLDALAGLDQTDIPQRIPESALPPSPTAPGIFRLRVFDDDMRLTLVPETPSSLHLSHTMVVMDMSLSTGSLPSLGIVEYLYDDFLLTAAPGSTFEVVIVGNNWGTAEVGFTLTLPEASMTPGEYTAFLLGSKEELPQLLKARKQTGSAIAEAIHMAASRLTQHAGPKTLYLLSDLKQQSLNQWDFSIGVPTEHAFLNWQRDRGLWMDLSGVSVTVIGWNHQASKRSRFMSADHSVEIRSVWEAMFARMACDRLRILTDMSGFPGFQGGPHDEQ
jgi:hypothetical protein